MIAALLGWLVVASLAGGLAFALDKRAAGRDRRRVPERVLLGIAAAGGSPGCLAARRWLRHKTVKQPFGRRLVAIAGAQGAVLVLAAGLAIRG